MQLDYPDFDYRHARKSLNQSCKDLTAHNDVMGNNSQSAKEKCLAQALSFRVLLKRRKLLCFAYNYSHIRTFSVCIWVLSEEALYVRT